MQPKNNLTSYKTVCIIRVTYKDTFGKEDNLIQVDELRGIIAKNGLSQSNVAEMLRVSPKTFYSKMKSGVFKSNEIQIMIEELHIENPMDIFFVKQVT